MAVTIPFVTQFNGKGIQRAIKEFKSLNSNLDRARFLTKRLVIPATVALTASTLALGKVLFDAARAASADEAGQKALERQLLNTTRATKFSVDMAEDYISKLEMATGIADDQLRPSLGRLASVTGDVTKAQQLLALALDVSAGSGQSLDEITGVLVAAMLGNYKGLKQLGIEYTSTGNRAKDLENITKLLAERFGGQAAVNAATFEGKMRILGVAFGNLQEAIGYAVLPALTRFVDYLTRSVVPGLQVVINAFSQKGLGNALVTAIALFGEFGISAINVLKNVALAVAQTVEKFRPLAQMAVLAAAPIIGFTKAWQLYNEVGRITANAVDTVTNKFDSLIAQIEAARYQMDLFAAASGNVNQNILGAEARLAGFGDKLKYIKPAAQETDGAVSGLGASIDKAGQRAEKMADALRDRMAQALDDAKSKLQEAQNAFDDFKGGVRDAIMGVVNFGDAAQYSAERGGVTFFDALEMQAKKAKEFGSLVDRLLAAGLSREALQQVIDAGQEAGSAIAKELLKSSENVLRANKLVEETQAIADKIAQNAAEKFYQAGITNGQAYVKGLEDAIAAANKRLNVPGLKPADVKGIGTSFDNTFAHLATPIAASPGMAANTIPSNTNVTVNTVTAPSNLGDVIVDALREYNRRSGPLQLQIE